MRCPTCQEVARRFGRNRNGTQRYQCLTCRRTFTPVARRPLGSMRLDAGRAVMCLRMLLEGTSIRSVERLTKVNRNTVMALLVTIGKRCERFFEETIRDVPVNDVQADEIWSYVGMKEKTRQLFDMPAEALGDAYCFTAMERDTKLMLAWHLGKRSATDTRQFAAKLARATSGRFQLTTDGFRPYQTAIPQAFGDRVDFAQLVKVYAAPEGEERRYGPPEVVGAYRTHCCGDPDPEKICTSHVERSNLTIRMTIRRLTRLTNAFSKKWENHRAALALFFCFYNWCRPHMMLAERRRAVTPAMAAGLTDHVWSVGELLRRMAASSTRS